MDIKEIVHYLRNEMPDYEWDEAAKALMFAFDRTHPGYTLALTAIPKFDLEERKWILDGAYQEMMQAAFDKTTGEPIVTSSGVK